MVKAGELRKGNFLINDKLDIFQNGYVEVEARHIYEIAVKESAQEYNDYVDCFKPIPLTEEWLPRFEFNYNSDNKHYWKTFTRDDDSQHSTFVVGFEHVERGLIYFGVCNSQGEAVAINSLKYVHQLQNAFKECARLELTLKE